MADARFNRQNLLWFGICAAGVLAFVLMFVSPNVVAMRELDAHALELTRKVQEQELLHPIYVALIRQAQQRVPEQLPLPGTGAISRTAIGDLHGMFTTMAREADVLFISAAPDPVSYMEENSQLTMNVIFSGDFFNFRPLLLRICQMPNLGAIDRLQIRTEADSRRMELKLRFNQL